MLSKITIICIIVAQIATIKPLQTFEDWIEEIAIFSIAVVLGSGVRIVSQAKERKEKVKIREIIAVMFIATALAAFANYLMRYYGYTGPRFAIVGVVSFFSEWIVIWLEKKYPQIFSGVLKKTTGITVDNAEVENIKSENKSETLSKDQETNEGGEDFNEEDYGN